MSESVKNLSETLIIINTGKNDEEEDKKQMEIFEEKKEVDELDLSFADIWPQVWKGCLANGLSFSSGVNTGFSTVFIAQLMTDPNIKEFSKTEASWIASLGVLSGPIGAFSIGPIMDKIGRKRAMMIANVFPILCWTITYSVTDSIWPLYVARAVGGAGAAMNAAIGVYTSEISHPKVRDVMMIMIGAFVSSGTLITMILGSYMEWHQAALSFVIMSAISFTITFFLPESPIWLVSFKPTQQRLNKALSVSRYFNRSEKLYEMESERLKEVYAKMKKSDTLPKKKSSFKTWLLENIKLFQERGVYKPMFILFMIFFFWAFSGVFVVLMYSANIFKAIGSHFGNGFDEYTATIIIGLVKLIMTIASAIISVKYGRRTLLMISGFGMAVTISATATFQSFSNSKLDFSKASAVNSTLIESNAQPFVSVMSVISLIIFILFGSLAMTNMPWALANELLPTRARAIGNSIIVSYSNIVMFTVLKSSPIVLEFISLSTLFFAFGTVSLLSVVYVYYKLPETFGRSFQEIEKYFIKNPGVEIRLKTVQNGLK